MKNIINTIKFLFWACVVTLGLTYVISLFDKWFNLEWLPNPFLLSISSGVFASLFVLFVMELKKYFEAKTSSINFIYYNCLSLYSDLWIQICHIDMLLEKQDEQVTNRLFAIFASFGNLKSLVLAFFVFLILYNQPLSNCVLPALYKAV